MTKDEIQEIAVGRELDALVAENVMGLEVYRSLNDWMQKGMPHIDQWSNAVRYPAYWHPVYELATVLSAYSSDISAAWEVVQKFHFFQLENRGYGGKKYWAVLSVCTENGEYSQVEAYGETLPDAICKAALSAMEGY